MNIVYKTELPTEAELLGFYEQMGWNDLLGLCAEQLLTAMRQSFFAVYAYAGGKLIAAGRVVSDGIINAYLCGIGVLSDYQKMGIGTEIANRLTTHCAEHSLHVQLSCNEELVTYYSKIGFKKFAIGMKK